MDNDLYRFRDDEEEGLRICSPHAYHLAGIDLRNNHLHGTSIVEALKVHEKQPTGELYLDIGRDKLGRWLARDFLEGVWYQQQERLGLRTDLP